MRRFTPLLAAFAAVVPLCRAQVPAPTISINPSSAVAGGPGFTLTVTGQNLGSYTTVRWGGTALSCIPQFVTQGPTWLSCSVPASYIASAGTVSIRAENYIAGYPTQYSNTVTFTIQPALTITTGCPLPTGTVGTGYSQTFSASGGVTPYTWWIPSGSVPPGLSISASTGTLSGTPTAAGTYSFTVGVRDYMQQTATKSCAVTIVSMVYISAISPTSWTAGCTGLTLTILGSGFVAQGSVVQWTDPATGALRTLQPTFVSSSELQVAIPDAYVSNFGTASIRVANPDGVHSNVVEFVVNPPPVIRAIDPVAATAGGPEFTLTVTGTGFVAPGRTVGPVGSLIMWLTPAGAAIELGTTFVSPTELRAQIPAAYIAAAGTARVAVSSPPCGIRSNSVTFEIVAPLVITTTSLPQGTAGIPYSATLAASGGKSPYSWALTGTLSKGLSFDSSSGTISGTPTETGSFPLAALVRDGYGATARATFTLTIVSGLSITTPSPLPNGAVGRPYSTTLAATSGQPPYSWAVTAGAPPAGLTLNASTGEIAGTPTAEGTVTFTVQVTDSLKATATKAFTLTVVGALTVTTASSLPAGTIGVAYGQTLAAANGTPPYSWSSTNLPAWLSLNSATGLLSGIPSEAGNYRFTATVTDSAKPAATASKDFSVTVPAVVGQLTITTGSPLPAGMASMAYSQTLTATGGTTPYRWSLSSGSLPPGLSLNAASGVISGTPTAAGSASFTVQVSDSNQRTATTAFTLTINAMPAAQYSGLTATVQPAQQPRVQLNLSAAVAATISGALTLSFAPDAVNPIDNPEVQFANGSRRVDFTIPAGQTRAQFGTAQEMGIQVGTVAGAITVAAAPLTGTVVARIERQAPTISSVRVTRTSSGFDVEIIGYATPRAVTSAAFTFTATGADLQTPTVTVNVDSAFTTWYRNTASNPFGSQFRYVQPFTVTGEATAVNSVRVTLTNATGTSSAASANF